MQSIRDSAMAAMNARLVFAMIAGLMLATPGIAQGCNPAIDGTYCNTLPKTKLDFSTPKQPEFGRIQSMGNDLSPVRDQPGTLGAITFRRDGTNCIGLFRRSSCN